MKKLILSSLIGLFACAGPSRTLGPGPAGSIAGSWQGVLESGGTRTVAEFRFASGEGGTRGFYWGRALVPVALTNVQVGRSIHFEIPRLGIFDGMLGDETIEGTFRDENGEGSFKLVKQLDRDDPLNGFSG